MEESSPKGWKTQWEKEKVLVTSNFSFSHSVFKSLVQQTHKNQGLFGKRLIRLPFHSTWLIATLQVKGDMYETNHFTVLPTFYGWTLFQVNLPQVETVNVTYDIRGLNVTFYSYVVLDDITVKPGYCPYYGRY